MATMKRKRGASKQKSGTITIRCCACHCQSVLDVADLPSTMIEKERESFIVCNECSPRMMQLEESGELIYFQSHFQDSVVLNSSHEVVKISRFLEFERRAFANQSMSTAISKAVRLLRAASAVMVLAGSGMSADSGLSTFRPAASSAVAAGRMHLLSLHDACYSSKPEQAWYYDAGYRRSILASEPHDGYRMLLQILESLEVPWFVVTTNIDRYFTHAGFPLEKVYETHGNIGHLQCSKRGADRCQGVFQWPEDAREPVLDDAHMSCDVGSVPRCPQCGAMARMNISHLPDEPADVDGSIKAVRRELAVSFLKEVHTLVVGKRRRVSDTGRDTGRAGGLVVLEVGCGTSAHGLQGESDLLLSRHPQLGFAPKASLIRINPDCGLRPAYLRESMEGDEAESDGGTVRQCVGISAGALDAINGLLNCMISEKSGNRGSDMVV